MLQCPKLNASYACKQLVYLTTLGGILSTVSVSHAQEAISAAEAAQHAGKKATVQMSVRATGTSANGNANLLSESSLNHEEVFIVAITPAAQEKLREMKVASVQKHFMDKFIRVTGVVRLAKITNVGVRPMIEVTSPSQIDFGEIESTHQPGEEALELYKSGKLFQRGSYKDVRAAFAKRFEVNHKKEIKKAFGDDHDELQSWLEKNQELKEQFYAAITERFDDVTKSLALFKQIWKTYPETLPRWGQLAIATAVTWDHERGVYDYKPHQARVKSTLPNGMMDALENYKFVVDTEKRMPQPVALYPWEFLVFVVNHRTPRVERNWAYGFFTVAKVKSKSWHKEVPYDFEIIKREVERDPEAMDPKLAGREYTLANIKNYGGVCAHQADFACRTAQSVGIPAVYCSGASAYRDNHAWWMFVNVSSATKDEIKFSLQSDGRFDGKDNFYTGKVLDPQSGRIMLDRDMERRLWLAGTDRVGHRQSTLVMRLYPAIATAASFTIKEKVAYLDQCLKISKYNEDAWLQFAKLAKNGELNEENKKIALGHLASLSQTFANYPDFIWRVFDDLIEVASPAEKVKQYESVLALFEKAKRPDLACDARLKLSDILVEQSKHSSALAGLATTIRKTPTEGRYVPQMLKKMEEAAPTVKGGPAQVGQVYIEVIPALIVYYRSDSNVYCKRLIDQARTFLNGNNLTQLSSTLEARIVQAKTSLKSKKN